MIKIGIVYKATNGRKFVILAKKEKPSSNGFDWIGEALDTGVVLFFNNKGEHAFDSMYNLIIDRHKWIVVLSKGDISNPKFEPKEQLNPVFVKAAVGYLGMEGNNPHSIKFYDPNQFRSLYA
jgi:hypothetical protein